jgi:HEPN domain-containing protein
MNPLTHEWIQKAEEDFEAARRLSRSRTIPLWNAVCFHARKHHRVASLCCLLRSILIAV